MIREEIKLPDNVLEKLPDLIQAVKQPSHVVALYSIGSVAKKELKPLSWFRYFTLTMQKSRIPQVQGIKVAAVVVYRKALITQVEDPVPTGRCGIIGFPAR